MTGIEIFAIGALAFGIGILIGCVGIGGVLLVPMLAYIFNVPVHESVAAAMFAYTCAAPPILESCSGPHASAARNRARAAAASPLRCDSSAKLL